jgi:aspartate racemase
MQEILGIVGGMGPFASAEFLKTIYDLNIGAVEQESPVCILYSDPTVPDRTEEIFNGSEEVLLARLVKTMDSLCRLGAGRIVIACVTIHYLLPRVPASLREKVISLIDIIFDEVLATDERHLLLCTSGTRKAGIFQNHDRWELIKPQLVFTNEDDQRLVHDSILKIKSNQSDESLCSHFDEFSKRYGVHSFIAGCTEFHLLLKRLNNRRGGLQYRFVDPLLTLARDLKRLVNRSGILGIDYASST